MEAAAAVVDEYRDVQAGRPNTFDTRKNNQISDDEFKKMLADIKDRDHAKVITNRY